MIQSIVNFFFYYKQLPSWLFVPGQWYPFDIACMCSLPNLFGLVFHVLIVALLIRMLVRNRELAKDRFFFFLLAGIVLSGASKLLDWYMNMRSAIGPFNGVYFSYPLDTAVGIFQLAGTAIILYAIIAKLFYIHHGSVYYRSESGAPQS